MPREIYSVLAIDGGGIRGVIPALLLHHLEHQLGASVSSLFDLIVGTSTGALAGLALVKPRPDNPKTPQYTAADLVDFYRDIGPTIFPPPPVSSVVMNWLRPRYSAAPLENALAALLGDATLRDCIAPIVVTSYDIETRAPHIFRTSDVSLTATSNYANNYYLRDIARATSAAPTYFTPCRMQATLPRSPTHSLIDGGVFANNPAVLALFEAFTQGPMTALRNKTHQLLLVSLGTGSLRRRYEYSKVKGWGLRRWARPILDIAFDGVSDHVDNSLDQFFTRQRLTGNYFRFQVQLTSGSDDLDNANSDNINALQALANSMIASNPSRLEQLLKLLKARMSQRN